MIRITILHLLLQVALIVIIAGAASSGQRARIVLPERPTEVEKFAGEELARCLQASLGWETGEKGNKTFYLASLEPGRIVHSEISEAEKLCAGLKEDSVYLKGTNDSVVLVGKGQRGALYAVYEFLERYVGCRWPEPGREFIPKRKMLRLETVDCTVEPALAIRGIAIHGSCGPEWFKQIVDWLAKNRMNSFQLFPWHYEQVRPAVLGDILKRGLMPNIGGHSREFFYPSEKYYQANPEYFALVSGKRTALTQICYSNYGSISDYAANVDTYLKSRPEIWMVGLWPSDGYGFCECDMCKSRPTTDVVLDYVNRLSEAVESKSPGIKTEFLSYIHYTAPPKDIKPLPYVVPTYCEYWSRGQFRPITDNVNENARLRSEIKGWIAASRQATIFSYYGDDCIKRYLYNPVMDVVLADVRYYSKIGLAGNFVLLTNPESWWSNAPTLYAYTKAAWDPRIRLPEIRKSYYDSMYGNAAKAMVKHEEYCRALFDTKTPQGGAGGDVLFGLGFGDFDPAKTSDTLRHFDSAVVKILGSLDQADMQNKDSMVKERIRKLRDDADYVRLTLELVCNNTMFSVTGEKAYKQNSIDILRRALATEVMSKDDKNGYRSGNNCFISIAKQLLGDEAIWLALKPGEVSDYGKWGIWRWKTEDIVPSSKTSPRKIVIDVTDKVRSAGKYQITWDYTMGDDAIFILSTALHEGSDPDSAVELTIDRHEGFTGAGDSENIYMLTLNKYRPDMRYYIVGTVYDERELTTFGQVLMKVM